MTATRDQMKRPMAITEAEMAERWQQAFGSNDYDGADHGEPVRVVKEEEASAPTSGATPHA